MQKFIAENGVEVTIDEDCKIFGVTEDELSDSKDHDLTEGLQDIAEEDGS